MMVLLAKVIANLTMMQAYDLEWLTDFGENTGPKELMGFVCQKCSVCSSTINFSHSLLFYSS